MRFDDNHYASNRFSNIRLKKAGCGAKVMVCDSSTAEYVQSAGADCYAADGVVAVNLAKDLLK